MRKKAEKLDTLNLLRKNKTLTKQATLNERFRELITGSDIFHAWGCCFSCAVKTVWGCIQ